MNCSQCEKFKCSYVEKPKVFYKGKDHSENLIGCPCYFDQVQGEHQVKKFFILFFIPAFCFAVSGSKQDLNHSSVGISVKEAPFNAYGDGIHDDSAAILSAVNAAAALTPSASRSRGQVYFPPGIYLISSSAVLTPTNSTHLPGIDYRGAGWQTSILRLKPFRSDLYFYNNGSAPTEQFCTFEDLGFQGMNPSEHVVFSDIPTHSKGFRLWATTATGSHEQGFKFTRCIFSFLDQVMDTEGDNTTSELKYFDCKISNIRNSVYTINNGQSVNLEFFGTDIESCHGDVFDVGINGGGGIKVYGGSIVMDSDAGVATNFISIGGSAGASDFPFTFNGMRVETRGDETNLINIPSVTEANLNFNDCLFLDEAKTKTKKDYVSISSYGRVHFNLDKFFELNGVPVNFVVNSTASLYGENGTIDFDRSGFSGDISSQCFITGNWGNIRANGCYSLNIGVAPKGTHYSYDFDSHLTPLKPGPVTLDVGSGKEKGSGSPYNENIRIKTAQIKLEAESWPNGISSETTLFLPKNSIIKNIYLLKPGFSSESKSITFYVGTNDKSVTFLASSGAAAGVAQSASVKDLFYNVGYFPNYRTLRLWSSGGVTTNTYGGLAIVDYY